jgi:hypothetical protein
VRVPSTIVPPWMMMSKSAIGVPRYEVVKPHAGPGSNARPGT